jgi:hypothetical protein
MVLPELIKLPLRDEDCGRIRTGQPQKCKQWSYVIISLIAQLKVLLTKHDVYAIIFSEKHVVLNDDISCYEDGTAYKDSSFFQRHSKALQIHLYLDEFTVVDPLSSKVLKNKLVFVYFTIGNLPLKFRTCLKHIHLVSIFLNLHVKLYGLNFLLKPIVDELKSLEQGVEIILHGKLEVLYGTLALFTADNLASHEVGGFKKGFARGKRKCRYCLGTHEEIQCFFEDGMFIRRTIASHDLQTAGLETNSHEHFAKVYGLNNKSILNELEHFHVVEGLVPDLMHDLHEGILPYVLCLLLHYFITEKIFFTIDQFNHALLNFNYGFSDVKDKPSLVDLKHIKNKRLRQSAAQIALLTFTLPLLIGSLIPCTDERWLCFTTLLEIFRLVLQSSFSQLDISNLTYLIYDFLSAFKTCFPNANIIPKMHHLVHYPRIIRLVGPLVAFWCMRYEAKHAYFKQIFRATRNCINLPVTLSYRHQLTQCKFFVESGSSCLSVKIVHPKKFNTVQVKEITCGFQLMYLFSIRDSEIIRTQKWVRYGSSTFYVNRSFVVCPIRGSSSITAAFGKITAVYTVKSQTIFLCRLYRCLTFDQHIQAFHVIPRRDKFQMFVTYDDLVDHRVYSVYQPVQHNVTCHYCHYDDFHYIVPKSGFPFNFLKINMHNLLRLVNADDK